MENGSKPDYFSGLKLIQAIRDQFHCQAPILVYTFHLSKAKELTQAYSGIYYARTVEMLNHFAMFGCLSQMPSCPPSPACKPGASHPPSKLTQIKHNGLQLE